MIRGRIPDPRAVIRRPGAQVGHHQPPLPGQAHHGLSRPGHRDPSVGGPGESQPEPEKGVDRPLPEPEWIENLATGLELPGDLVPFVILVTALVGRQEAREMICSWIQNLWVAASIRTCSWRRPTGRRCPSCGSYPRTQNRSSASSRRDIPGRSRAEGRRTSCRSRP